MCPLPEPRLILLPLQLDNRDHDGKGDDGESVTHLPPSVVPRGS
jgi:hypothetical protein